MAADTAKPPIEFGPEKRVLWKTALPAGHSSPCIWRDRLFITGFDKASGELLVIALKRADGSELWRRSLKPPDIERVHAISSPATGTPATDGKRVYVYFGSYGLAAYAMDGTPAWETPLPLAKSSFGSGVSPVLGGGLVFVSRDYPPEPKLLAFSMSDGKPVWTTALTRKRGPGPNTAHSTPVIWHDQVVLHRPEELSAYSLKDGTLQWWVKVVTNGTGTPVATPEAIYVPGYYNFGEPGFKIDLPSTDEFMAKYDVDKDGKVSREEAPSDLYIMQRAGIPASVPGAHMTIKSTFNFIDGNKNGFIEPAEWTAFTLSLKMIEAKPHGLTAVKPSGTGDITAAAVVWVERRNVAEVPAPLFYRGRVYMVVNGGIISCLDAATGKLIYRGRTGAPGAYFSSPVAADGHIFVASAEGVVSVLDGGDELSVVSKNDLGEPIYATPAFVDSVAYIRTASYLWAFGAGRESTASR